MTWDDSAILKCQPCEEFESIESDSDDQHLGVLDQNSF